MGRYLRFSSSALGTTNNLLMKPKMLLVGGFSWSATSPLVYTLQRNAKYAHFGYTKQFKYLGPEGRPESSRNISDIYEHVRNGTWENYKSDEPGTHRMNLTVDLEPLSDFPVSHFTKLMDGDHTTSKYMDFYHALHDHVISKGYKSVGDCYMGYKTMREDLKEFYDTLKFEFDVKVLLIARDPVRRAFSEYLYSKLKTPRPLVVMNYTKVIDHISSIFDDVHVTVMEELWEGDAKKQLSDFLDHPVTDLWKNLYSPDKGHLVEHDDDVPCQAFGQELEELTTDKYNSIKDQYQAEYDLWKDRYGSLPRQWGEPLDYKFDYWHI